MKKKKIKINLMLIIGMMVAIGTVAFTTPKNEIINSNVWYEFTQQIDADPSNPDNYTLSGLVNPAQCKGNAELCAIRASDNGATPDHDELESLQGEISDGEPTDNVSFKP